MRPNSDDSGSSSLHGGGGTITNVATQDICPLDLYEHLGIGTADPVAYALAIDALGNDGPADPARIAASTCLQVLMPGINPVTYPLDAGAAAISLATSPSTMISAEPALRCYVTASCSGQAAGTATATAKSAKRCKRRKYARGHRKHCRKHHKQRHR